MGGGGEGRRAEHGTPPRNPSCEVSESRSQGEGSGGGEVGEKQGLAAAAVDLHDVLGHLGELVH